MVLEISVTCGILVWAIICAAIVGIAFFVLVALAKKDAEKNDLQ